jgi:hypothetical protein
LSANASLIHVGDGASYALPKIYMTRQIDKPQDSVVPAALEAKQISHYVSGAASFNALKVAVQEMVSLAPEDHDVLIKAFNVIVTQIRYIEPHTFILSGFLPDGHHTSVVCHYSQIVAHVIYLPKKEKKRMVIGFSTS